MDPNQAPLSGTLPDGLSEALSRLMANPEVMGAVASALGKSPPEASAPTDPPAAAPTVPVSAEPAPSLDALATLAPLLSGLSGAKTPDNDRTRLLRALKPYVNPKRKDAIETMLRFSGMTDLLGQFNRSGR